MKFELRDDGAVLNVSYHELALIESALISEKLDEQRTLELLSEYPDSVETARKNIDEITEMLGAMQ